MDIVFRHVNHHLKGDCYPTLLRPLETVVIYSYGKREYTAVVCEAFILDKGKAGNICYSTALVGRDNSMYQRYKILVRANNKNKSATLSVHDLLKRRFTCVTNDYYIKHIKYPEFEGDIIELNNCEVWETFDNLDYDISLKKKSKDMLIQAAKISETYDLNFENQ